MNNNYYFVLKVLLKAKVSILIKSYTFCEISGKKKVLLEMTDTL